MGDFLNELFRVLIPSYHWRWEDYVLSVIVWILVLLVGFLMFLFVSWLAKMIFYEFSYAAIKQYDGSVVEMEYTPSRTTYNAATKTTQYHSEKNEVTFQTELGTTTVDSDRLYQRVRIGESVIVESQSYHVKPRFWDGNWEYDGERLISVISVKNQKVNFNDGKPVTYRGR